MVAERETLLSFMPEDGESDVESAGEFDSESDVDESARALPPGLCMPGLLETPFLPSSTGLPVLPKGFSDAIPSCRQAASDNTGKGKGVDRGKDGEDEDALNLHEGIKTRYAPWFMRGMSSLPAHSTSSAATRLILGDAMPDDERQTETGKDRGEDQNEDIRVTKRRRTSKSSPRGTIGKGKEVERDNDEKEVQDILSRYGCRILARSPYLDPGFPGYGFRGLGGASVGFANHGRSPSTCLHCAPGNHRYRGPGRSKICQAAEASGSGIQHHGH